MNAAASSGSKGKSFLCILGLASLSLAGLPSPVCSLFAGALSLLSACNTCCILKADCYPVVLPVCLEIRNFMVI